MAAGPLALPCRHRPEEASITTARIAFSTLAFPDADLATAGLPAVAVDSSIRLTGEDPAAELRQFLELASDWEAPLVRVFGQPSPAPGGRAGGRRLG
jgi:hypothetical protein